MSFLPVLRAGGESESQDMPKIDIAALKTESRTGYPEPFRQAVQGRSRKRLGDAVGLDQFGVNLTTLKRRGLLPAPLACQ